LTGTLPPIRASVLVALPIAEAFDLFARGMGRWWPRAYSRGADGFVTVVIELQTDGRWYERDLDGVETDWGRVRDFDPARYIRTTMRVNPLRMSEPHEVLSEVEFLFRDEGDDHTRVEVEQAMPDMTSEGAARLREEMRSVAGWSFILAAFAGAAREHARDLLAPPKKRRPNGAARLSLVAGGGG
jgi:hypothetical protein